jgi:sensor histidine kinase YesM
MEINYQKIATWGQILKKDLGKILLISMVISAVLNRYFCPKCFTERDFGFSVTIYFYATFTWFLLWKGNALASDFAEIFNFRWLDKPFQRFFFELSYTLVYTTIIVIILYYIFFVWILNIGLDQEDMKWQMGFSLVLTFVISLFLNSIKFLSAWRDTAVNAEKLKAETISSRYETLKNQVNPHFLFNSFNALSSLIYEDQDLAVKFVRQLSDVYRYVLDSREKEVVSLSEELSFLESYIFLQKIRHRDSLQIELNLPQNSNILVAPLSLQLLVENAIKHNVVSEENPLLIKIYLENDQIMVGNPIQKKRRPVENSSGMGLKNIVARYEYLSSRPVEIANHDGSFVVKLPVLSSFEKS